MPDSSHSIPNSNAASPGMQRQFDIYQLGLAGKKLSIPIPLAQLEKKAAEVLSPQAYDYVAGSASGERTARANLGAFDRWRIVPRMLRDVSQRDLTVELFGQTLPAPSLLTKMGCWNHSVQFSPRSTNLGHPRMPRLLTHNTDYGAPKGRRCYEETSTSIPQKRSSLRGFRFSSSHATGRSFFRPKIGSLCVWRHKLAV